ARLKRRRNEARLTGQRPGARSVPVFMFRTAGFRDSVRPCAAGLPVPLIRIFSRGNGHGLSRDLGLVAGLLADAGNVVEPVAFSNEKGLRYLHMGGMWLERGWKGRADLQISLEHIYPPALPLARRNLWMPNPEWFKPRWRDDLGDLSGTLCKTRHAEDIFAGFGCRPRFVGFTSEDRIDHAVP